MTESTREPRAEAALGGGLFVEARSLYSVLLAAAELEHGFDHPESLRLASCLAKAASGLGERTEAADLRSRIAAACERLHGRDDDRTLAALHQLAEALYWASNRRDESTWPDQARGYVKFVSPSQRPGANEARRQGARAPIPPSRQRRDLLGGKPPDLRSCKPLQQVRRKSI